ncbi:hypothetical protein RO21_06175 [[Actinobacillus] muris]|uniref:DUF4810 domain-containing protein n=1 Tax=Muribacter muris TaxID=67855 RepID=A0A0J5S3S5_9PAST|nr:DUF4810 domain-containing protein [Muribacter muris]KMK51447.1 hypothetical protein RO21_06175 [[Actinobacillus] muris] [Muribacter muris]MBF0785171.1 DUF4810 domain-containing protein [Muribacter muris]MBF0827415.1 DUF4810 domain-containing protein [Muribacter muris]TFV10122.1 DUF4810 domain-containing protein [Muribacter muris]
MIINKKLAMIVCIMGLTACGTRSEKHSIYHWDSDYSQSVYQTLLQEGNPQEQLQSLEQMVAKGEGKTPPGLYAQIGLLYNQIGNVSKAKEAFTKETQLFPESKQYIQFLLTNGVKGVKK